ncbi:TonB-dependent receptor [Pelomonas sp. P8]|uniref:TonB-dependent receptor n=2 Tax=Pelomonas cellulosilytica TaxID=2906762 RepID=A0ABS8Y3Z9_9BURK|nr:TonB-dependent receptor [Pelomonas sp. P8]
MLAALALQGGACAAAEVQEGKGIHSPLAAYDLPAGPLPATLDAIGRISGRTISFDRARLADQSASALKGSYTPKQALEAAVAGKKVQVSEDEATGVLNLYVVGELDLVMVYAKRDQAEKGFKADRSDTATRSGTDLMDLAGAMTIITSKVLETQQATNLRDTLRNVSGVTFTDSPQGLPTFSVRGFNRPSSTTNGIPDQGAGQTSVFGVERVEVLKGPQAILAGGGSLGGGVNVVLKKPSAEPVRDLMVQYGTNSDRTIAGDLSGAIFDDKRLTYRLIASSARAGTTDAGYDGRSSDSAMPQLRWKDKTTDLIAGLSYEQTHAPLPQYTVARRDGVIMPTPGIPLTNRKDGFDFRQKRVFYQLEQKLSSSMTLISRLQRSDDVQKLHQYATNVGLEYDAGAAPDNPNGMVSFAPVHVRTTPTQTSGDHYLRMLFNTGDIDHKFVVGFNHDSYRAQQTQWDGAEPTMLTVYPVGMFVDLPRADLANPTLSYISEDAQRQKALYLQDQISWKDWILQLNWRRTLVKQESSIDFREFNFTSTTPAVTTGRNIPGVGLVYRMTPTVSVYGNVANGFDAQNANACSGGLVPPVSSKNKEVGAKFSMLDDKLSLTTAAFQIDQSGTLVYDRTKDCYNVRAAQRSKGLELDLQGQFAPGWEAIANYTYSTSKDVGDQTAVFPGKPRHKFSLWTTYNVPQVHGLGVGLGVSAQSSMLGTYDSTRQFHIPKRVQVDASLFYEIPGWSLTLGVKNLADRLQYDGTTAETYIPVIQGRNFMFTAKHSFN